VGEEINCTSPLPQVGEGRVRESMRENLKIILKALF
jgi:hypothetical protein